MKGLDRFAPLMHFLFHTKGIRYAAIARIFDCDERQVMEVFDRYNEFMMSKIAHVIWLYSYTYIQPDGTFDSYNPRPRPKGMEISELEYQ